MDEEVKTKAVTSSGDESIDNLAVQPETDESEDGMTTPLINHSLKTTHFVQYHAHIA